MKIIHEIINFFKALLVTVLGFFFKSKKVETKPITKQDDEESSSTESSFNIFNETSLPDDINNKANPHDEDTTNDNVLLKVPKSKINTIKTINESTNKIIFTEAYISKLIEEELEIIYKEEKLKIDKLDERFEEEKEILKTIKKFEEKVVPIIERNIEFYHLEKEEDVKKTVHNIVEVEIKEFPILEPVIEITEEPKINKIEKPIIEDKPKEKEKIEEPIKEEIKLEQPPTEETKKEKEIPIYSLAYQTEKKININPVTPLKIKAEPIITVEDKKDIETKLEEQPVTMIQNVEEIPKQTISDTIKNTAAVGTEIVINSIADIVLPEEKKKKEETEKKIEEISTVLDKDDIRNTKETEELKEELEEHIKELEHQQEEQEKKEIEHQNELQETEKEKLKKEIEETKEKQEEAKSLVRDTEIKAIEIETDEAIELSKAEIEKEDFFDKDYDKIEEQINHMLEDIENTRLRYGDKLSKKQQEKLAKEESKLRAAKENIETEKSNDIIREQNEIYNEITERELNGLQEELKRIEEENKKEVSEEFLRRMDTLQGMTADEVEREDKKMLFRRLDRASFLLEMGSILTFPFIRNKYFLGFTLGLMIHNHFSFINAFWRRKAHRQEPIDLDRIKQGQDALNGALDITYQNIIELDKIEQDALSRYPDLASDPRFINQITNLRIRLNNNYNKLMKKNKIMETYYGKAKHHVKVLKKDLQRD